MPQTPSIGGFIVPCIIVLCDSSAISGFRPRLQALLMAIVVSGQALAVDWTNTSGVPEPWYHVGGNWAGGVVPGSSATARFDQGASYEVWWDNTTAATALDVKFLDVPAGEVTFLNHDGGAQHVLLINGSGGFGNYSDLSISGGKTRLINRGLYLASSGGARILDGATLTLDGSHAQGARFGVNGGFQVDGTVDVEAGAVALTFEANIGTTADSMGEVTVTGESSTWASGFLRVGKSGHGMLNVASGGVVSVSNGRIGDDPGSTGVATVSGAGSQWTNRMDMVVGFSGDATLNIEAGGVVNNSTGWMGIAHGSKAMVTVTGIGSQWNSSRDLEVGGWQGDGILNVEAGGVVNTTFSNIALFGTGVATVTGMGSQWNNSDNLSVGRYGHGTLNVEAGGVVTSLRGLIGRNSYGSGFGETVGTGVATVTGAGSQWIVSGPLSVGAGGHATLNVEAGGVVSNVNGYIGESPVPMIPDATAVVTVTGSGSLWSNSAGLYLGGTESAAFAKGVLNVRDHGHISVGGTLKIWGTGTLQLDGGTIQAAMMDHTSGGRFNFLGGILDVGIFEGNLVQDGGTMVIGSSPGITHVTKNYNQRDGAIEIEIFSDAGGSPVAGTDFDQLFADSMHLSGTLELVAAPGYSPALGNTFTILDTNSGVWGEFSAVRNVELPGGLTFDVIYGANEVTLAVIMVPEPLSWMPIVVGLLGVSQRRRRQR